MSYKSDLLLQELEARLDENRRIVSRSILPGFFYPLASYLGFHAFRVMFLLSLILTGSMFLFVFEEVMLVSRWLFIYR